MRSGVQNIKIGNLAKADAYQLHRILRENIVHDPTSPSGQPLPVILQSPEHPTHAADSGEQLCQKCGRKVASDFALCPFCRYPFKVECPECGKRIDRKFKLCPYCGEDLSYLEQIDLEL
jgi:RNA polymerase subunit RPABC4/transcription elongation factor Spt4